MHPFPHRYNVAATSATLGNVRISANNLPDIESAPPLEFDGPGTVWSPETLLGAAVADCFILTFRAIARASKFEWSALECTLEARLERVEGGPQFTHFKTVATLTVPAGTDLAKARLLMDKAEHGCLIANSLKGSRELLASVVER